MGCGSSIAVAESSDIECDEPVNTSTWRLLMTSDEARKKFENDGSLPPSSPSSLLELRGFLDDPMLLKELAVFGKRREGFGAFMCWIDIQEFKTISSNSEDLRRSKANHIFTKYINESATVPLKHIEDNIIITISSKLSAAKQSKLPLPNNLYDVIQQQCLAEICEHIFNPFKHSPGYSELINNMHDNYNRVLPDDFKYIDLIGSGFFGIVVHCKKKSTGKHYALSKILLFCSSLLNYIYCIYRNAIENGIIENIPQCVVPRGL